MKIIIGLALALVAASPLRAGVAPADRWLEIEARPRSASEAGRLSALGWETKEREDGATLVYLRASGIAALAATGIPHSVVQDDLEAAYAARLALPKVGRGSMGGYFTWTEAIAEMDALAAAHPDLVAPRIALGVTHEGRPIWAWKLSTNAAVDEPEPSALFMSLMHAREPVGMMSLVHFAESLLAGHGSDAEATWLLDHREIWIVPVLNADGYVRNETRSPGGGGMWRKNRRDNGDGTRGVDPNRNFSYEWAHDDAGSSPNTGSDTYRGPGPMSEPETQALRDFVAARSPAISVNTHAYGDLMIRPWGYVDGTCADEMIMADISDVALRGSAYRPGNSMATVAYLANGEHDDYMWGEIAEKPRSFGFTPELGNRDDGFWPAASRIDPICREALPMHSFLAWAAGSAPRLESFVVDDAAPGGDGDGLPEPGETIRLTAVVRNHGLGATSGSLMASLDSATCAAWIEDGGADCGVIASQTSASNAADPFVVHVAASATPGDLVRLRLILSDTGGDYPPADLSFLIGEPVVLFAEDFEGGLAAWAPGGFATEAAGASRAGLALSDSPGGSHGSGVDAVAELLQPIDLSGFGRAWLVFDQRFWIDNDFDGASVEVLPAGGSWTPVAGRSSDTGSGAGAQDAGSPVWDGRRPEWEAEHVDLSMFAGSSDPISVRFRFRSDGSIAYDGWHVDDVRLIAFPEIAILPPDEPLLFVGKSGDDVALAWTAPPVGPDHSAADAYVIHRSPSVRGDAGFSPMATTRALGATDAGVVRVPQGFAYTVVATNCAGP